MRQIGVGVIGCGDIARVRFFPSIEALPELTLAGVYSRSRSRAEEAATRYGGKIHEDLESFLADPAIEAVVIATPHPSHAELTVRALEAGKHVLTEKPIATSSREAGKIRLAAERPSKVFMPLPFDDVPPMIEAKRLIDDGAIGFVNSADAVLAHNGPSHAPWFFDRELAGWGVLADLGIYLISQLIYLFGPADSVFGKVGTILPERVGPDGRTTRVTVEDNAAAVMTWKSGVYGTIRANWCSTGDRRNVIRETRIYGTKGIVFINLGSPANHLVIYSPERAVENAAETSYGGMDDCYVPSLPTFDQHRDIVAAFARSIARGQPTAEERRHSAMQFHVIDVIDRLYDASRSGTEHRLEPP
jgi:predicted dehydrogenase